MEYSPIMDWVELKRKQAAELLHHRQSAIHEVAHANHASTLSKQAEDEQRARQYQV